MGYTNSPLVDYTRISPNNSGIRNHTIDRITPHCVVGQLSVEVMGNMFADPGFKASSNYGIGSDTRVGMYVPEDKRSWCSSSGENDNRAVTIECASDKTHPYAFKPEVYAKLIDLCVDICQRNGKKKLSWFGQKAFTLSYTPEPEEMVLTVHRWFAAKACPGDWMMARMGDLAEKVTNRLGGIKYYRVGTDWVDGKCVNQVGAYTVLDNAKAAADQYGYKVFDSEGVLIYQGITPPAPEPGKYPKGKPASKEAYIAACGSIARELMKETRILASVVTAQCCLETGFGLGPDSTPLMAADVNNLLGMKVSLINSSWQQYSVWHGDKIKKKTPEYKNGKMVMVDDWFRKYTDYENCIHDYESFLSWVKNDKGYKYRRIIGMTDPAAVIHAIRIGTGTSEHPEGYCTDPAYEGKILDLIKQYNLRQYDVDAPAPQPTPTPPAPEPSDKKYRVRVGIYNQMKYLEKLRSRIKEATGLDCFTEGHSDGTHIYCGSFDNEGNAKEREKLLNDAGFKTEIEEA